VFETFVGKMLQELRRLGLFDGCYLCVHGTAGVRGRPEAESAKRVRAAIGPAALMAGSNRMSHTAGRESGTDR
jgi:microcystin degradation protein MlrC